MGGPSGPNGRPQSAPAGPPRKTHGTKTQRASEEALGGRPEDGPLQHRHAERPEMDGDGSEQAAVETSRRSGQGSSRSGASGVE